MKNIKYLATIFIAFFSFQIAIIAAPTASISVNRSSIENGSTVTATITVNGTAAWNITVTSAGATSGCNDKFVGDSGTGNNVTRSFSTTCRSTSTGIISFTISGDITSSDGKNVKVSGSRSVTVVAPRPKSTNNYLKSIIINDGEVAITPDFSKDTHEYVVELEPETKSLSLKATAEDASSNINGVGTIELNEGDNEINIVVTSESGSSRTYKIIARVKELSPIIVKVDDKEFNIVRKKEHIINPPLTYEETTITINGEIVPAYKNSITKFTLVALRDEEGKIEFYIYDSDNDTYQKYNELTFNRLIIFVEKNDGIKIPKNYSKFVKNINGVDTEVYKITEDSSYALIYGLNVENGRNEWYMYDSREGTLQRYNNEEVSLIREKLELYFYVIIGLISLTTLFLIIIIILIASLKKSNKKEKIPKIKKEKEPKVKKKKNKNLDFGDTIDVSRLRDEIENEIN